MDTSYVAVGTVMDMITDSLTCRPQKRPRRSGRWRGLREGLNRDLHSEKGFSATYNTFYHQRHLLKRPMFTELRNTSFDAWQVASVAA